MGHEQDFLDSLHVMEVGMQHFFTKAMIGNITAFGCTVVSTTTRAKSLSAVSFASPIRCRHRVSDERSNGSRCWKNSSPQKNWK